GSPEVMDDRDAEALCEALRWFHILPEDSKLPPQRVLEWYRPMWKPILEEEQPFTFTPEFAAEVVQQNDPLGEFGDVLRGLTFSDESKDYTFLARIEVGLWSVLGALHCTAPWREIHEELVFDGPPATELGRQHAAW